MAFSYIYSNKYVYIDLISVSFIAYSIKKYLYKHLSDTDLILSVYILLFNKWLL